MSARRVGPTAGRARMRLACGVLLLAAAAATGQPLARPAPGMRASMPGPASGDARAEMATHWAAQVQAGPAAKAAALLIDGRVDDLDRLVQDAASADGRDAAGRWTRSQVYTGIASVFPDEPAHPLWPALDRITADWLARRPASHAAALARAQYWISHAWAARGDGYPVTPSAARQQAFEADLQQAERVLDAHEQASPKATAQEPHWAVMRIKVHNLLGRDKTGIHQLAIGALRQHPDYDPIAAEAALALSPAWGGTTAQAKAFIDEAMAIARPVSGEQLRARIAIHLARNAGQRQALLLAQTGFTWESVKPAIDEVIARYPDLYNVNAARMLGCISDIPARARPYFERLQGRIQPVAWFDDPWYVDQCARQAGWALAGHAPWTEGLPPERPATAATVPAASLALSTAVAVAGGVLALLVFLRLQRPPAGARVGAPLDTPREQKRPAPAGENRA